MSVSPSKRSDTSGLEDKKSKKKKKKDKDKKKKSKNKHKSKSESKERQSIDKKEYVEDEETLKKPEPEEQPISEQKAEDSLAKDVDEDLDEMVGHRSLRKRNRNQRQVFSGSSDDGKLGDAYDGEEEKKRGTDEDDYS